MFASGGESVITGVRPHGNNSHNIFDITYATTIHTIYSVSNDSSFFKLRIVRWGVWINWAWRCCEFRYITRIELLFHYLTINFVVIMQTISKVCCFQTDVCSFKNMEQLIAVKVTVLSISEILNLLSLYVYTFSVC